MGRKRQGSWAGVFLVVVLFLVSFGASAGATVLIGSSAQDSGTAAELVQTPSPSPSETTSASASTPTPSSTSSAQPTPKPSPTVATKVQRKEASAALCKADAQALPTLTTRKADKRWTQVAEVHMSKKDISPGPIDGVYDAAAARGARALQKSLGAPLTGQFDDATWSALWTDQCYVPPAEVPTPNYVPDYSGGGGSSGGGGGSSGGGGGGTLDRVE